MYIMWGRGSAPEELFATQASLEYSSLNLSSSDVNMMQLLRADKLVPLLRHETDAAERQRHIMIGVEPRADGDSLIHRILTEQIYRERQSRPGLRALFLQMEYSDMKKALVDEEIDLALFLHAGEPLGAPLTLRTVIAFVITTRLLTEYPGVTAPPML